MRRLFARFMIALCLGGAALVPAGPGLGRGVVAAPRAATTATIIALPPLVQADGAVSVAYGIDAAGTIVGYASDSSYHGSPTYVYALRWAADGTPRSLGAPYGSYAYAIGADGAVVGTTDPPTRAVRWHDGTATALGTLTGGAQDTSTAYAVGPTGQVVGTAERVGCCGNVVERHAVLWDNGTIADLSAYPGTPAGQDWAFGINGRGQVVGQAGLPPTTPTGSGVTHAALWSQGAMTDLGTYKPGNDGFSAARAINDQGWIVGWAQGADDRNYATIWAEGRMIDLGCPDDCSSAEALAVNNMGQAVGTAGRPGSQPTRAYLWQDGAAVDLLTLLPTDSGWQLFVATGINDRGQIVGWGYYQGVERGFLLTLPGAPGPSPSPSPAPSPGPSPSPSPTASPSPSPSPSPAASPSPSPSASPSPPTSPSPAASPSPRSVPSFADVPPGHWAHDQIGAFAQRGITTGCDTDALGNRYYCPERGVTRAEMATFLDRTLGFPTPATPASQRFSDVPPAYWAYAFIDRFAMLGITTGCGGTEFCPDRGVDRAEMAAFLIRALKQSQVTPATLTFADVPASHPQFGYIEALVQLGVTTGCGTNDAGQRLYCPERGVTRAEMAVFIIRAFP